MIPAFDDDGNLPPGIHNATIEEIRDRFTGNIIRKELFVSLLKLMKDIKVIGCKTIYLDGSFVTNKDLPGDIDICWDNRNVDLKIVQAQMPVLFDVIPPRIHQKASYSADILPAFSRESNSKKYFIYFFQEDKNTGNPKGIIQINIQ